MVDEGELGGADEDGRSTGVGVLRGGNLTEELELTVAESQAFWPVYNERQNKEHELRELQRMGFKKLIGDEPSEKEVEKMLYSFADTQIAIEELRKSYLEDFIDVIGAQKTAKLMRAEKEFGRRMMERMKGKDRPRDKGRGPGSDGGRPMR